jgi:murein DD-endopeptidase MepM/ murein hydrolase activator NlpD
VLNFHRIKKLFKEVFTPVTIMLIPHSKNKPLNFKIPFIGIFSAILFFISGIAYTFSIAVNTFEYYRMKDKLNYYTQQFIELNSTISALKEAEIEFKRLFSLGSKEKILENVDSSDSGSIDIDMENIREQIKKTTETVREIKDYLCIQRDIYLATPRGLPVQGNISSYYGKRNHPTTGKIEIHSGIDISTEPGSPIRATADGVVSFSGLNEGSGNLVVLEHGYGFSTVYAHNKTNIVKVGQRVKRGDIIAYAGSTGNSTGPHVHYEIWKEGRHINPKEFIEEKS